MLRRAVLVCMVVLTAVMGCTRSETPTAQAPDFALQDLSGKNVRLSDLKGKVVLVEFWATWCPPCREAIPEMEKLHKAYRDKGLVVLGISVDSSGADMVRSFAREQGITYSVLQGNNEVADQYQVRVIPVTYLVNREGLIARHYVGGTDGDKLEKEIKALL